ncbi:MAG: adenylate kinase [Elusimicrobia bacterium]|nr:adenylate kinase [Elusimicrobiota bacterium]
MRIILLGAPGSGKGTQAALFSQKLNVPHVATGNIFRDEISRKTDLGLQVESFVKSGRLVPDATVLEMVMRRLERPDCVDGFLLDGFPRTIDQARRLGDFLIKKDWKINRVFCLDINTEVLVTRLSERRQCSSCQVVYNLVTKPPRQSGACDHCGNKLIQRSDDEPNTVRKRLMVYQDLTSPLVAFYRATESFVMIQADRGVDEVTDQIAGHLNGVHQ